jgi:hypothetical protein
MALDIQEIVIAKTKKASYREASFLLEIWRVEMTLTNFIFKTVMIVCICAPFFFVFKVFYMPMVRDAIEREEEREKWRNYKKPEIVPFDRNKAIKQMQRNLK